MADGSPSAAGGRKGQLESSALRPGWTTGACATAAARAAWTALVTGEFPDPVTVNLPQGRTPSFALTFEEQGPGWAMAAVTKDAGDDPDVTHGAVVRATVRRGAPGTGVTFVAGPGVGTVTLPGLPLAVGEPAINPSPRAMIRENVGLVCGDEPDIIVEISIDHGEELAAQTLNARVGVLGGLSVLGTTGVVVPYSCSAWIASIRRGVDVAVATGQRVLAACTGSTSERVVGELFGLPEVALLDMGDFAGAVLKQVRKYSGQVDRLVICGGVAKLSKLADGHLDLHSARSHVDLASLAELAKSVGANESLCAGIAAGKTVLGAMALCEAEGVPLGDAIAARAKRQAESVLARTEGLAAQVDVVCIDRAGGVVGRS